MAGRQAGDGELDPTIARLVGKLARKKWVILYDSLKATFTLQAEGIAREVVFEAMAAAADAAARDALGGRGGGGGAPDRRRGAAAAELEGLRSCVAAWEAYKDWCEEVRKAATAFVGRETTGIELSRCMRPIRPAQMGVLGLPPFCCGSVNG